MREYLRNIVEEDHTLKGRLFDYGIQFLILLSLVTFSLETLPDRSEQFYFVLYLIEVGCVLIFSVEYIIRIYVARQPFQYIFSFYGIIDLVAILPFYLHLALDLRILRAFRIMRLFRILKLIRYNKALKRFHLAYTYIKEELVLFFAVTSILMFLTAAGIYYFEHEAQPALFKSIFHSFWWAVVTLTTVGYGDVYPITLGGRIFTFFVLIIGVGIVTVPAGLVASALSKARNLEEQRGNKMKP